MDYIGELFDKLLISLNEDMYNESLEYIEKIYKYIYNCSNIDTLKYIDKMVRKYAYGNIVEHSIRGTILSKLKDMSIVVRNKINNVKTKKYYDVIDSLIYDKADIEYIKKLLNSTTYDKYTMSIFMKIIHTYVTLSNEEDISYYNSVIYAFFDNDKDNILIMQKNKYINYLSKYCYIYHVSSLISVLSDKYRINIEDLARSHRVCISTSKEVEEEKFKIKYNSLNRKDYTKLLTVSIDSDGSKCLDDAISLVKNPNGSYYLYIFIVDIPSVIPYDSHTFKESLSKMETRYLINDTISMYPSYLSYNLCSLLQNRKRCVISHRYLVDSNFNIDIDSLLIERAYISVNSNLNYKQSDKIIKNTNRKYSEMLNGLLSISLILKKHNKGKEEYRNIENIISRSSNNASVFLDNYISPNIIQELMILVNYTKARYMKLKGYPYQFRNNISFSEELLTRDIKLALENLEVCSKADYKKVLAIMNDKYMKCFFSKDCLGHKGLGYNAYAWSTSPSRRAPDSFNQYLEYQLLFSENIIDKNIYELEELVDYISTYFNGLDIRNNNFNREYNTLVRKKMLVGSEKL